MNIEDMGERKEDDLYGEKILKKFGWFPGRGLGRNPKGDIQALFFSKPRLGRLGVGAELPGEELSAKKAALSVGDHVLVTKGKHSQTRGVIAEIDDEYALIEVGAKQIRVPLLYLDQTVEDVTQLAGESQRVERKPLRWVMPGIRVRVVSKAAREGRLYNVKGVVQDVTGSSSFTLLTDSRDLLDDLSERDVETLIPAVGTDVMVLTNDHRGEVGKLMERDKKRNRVLVQLESASQVLKLTQDDVSELAMR